VHVFVSLATDYVNRTLIRFKPKGNITVAVVEVAKIKSPVCFFAPVCGCFTLAERCQRHAITLTRYRNPQVFQNRRHDIHALGERINAPPPVALHPRPRGADDERNVKGLIEIAIFGELPMVAQLLSMVGGEYHQCIFVDTRLLEISNQPADVCIHFAYHPIVSGACLQHVPVIEFEVVFRFVIVTDAPASLVVKVVA